MSEVEDPHNLHHIAFLTNFSLAPTFVRLKQQQSSSQTTKKQTFHPQAFLRLRKLSSSKILKLLVASIQLLLLLSVKGSPKSTGQQDLTLGSRFKTLFHGCYSTKSRSLPRRLCHSAHCFHGSSKKSCCYSFTDSRCCHPLTPIPSTKTASDITSSRTQHYDQKI